MSAAAPKLTGLQNSTSVLLFHFQSYRISAALMVYDVIQVHRDKGVHEDSAIGEQLNSAGAERLAGRRGGLFVRWCKRWWHGDLKIR